MSRIPSLYYIEISLLFLDITKFQHLQILSYFNFNVYNFQISVCIDEYELVSEKQVKKSFKQTLK